MKAVMVYLFAIVTLSVASIPGGVGAIAAVVVSQVQPGDAQSATNEAVEIYNNTLVDQDVTSWCLRYSSATSQALASSPKYCFLPADAQTHIFLAPQSYATIVTAGYSMVGGVSPDGRFSGSGIAATGGHIKLVDAANEVVDTVGWGTGVYSEGYVPIANPAPVAPSSLQAMIRKVQSPGVLQDTDNNRSDFELKAPAMRTGGIFEVRTAIDICGNLPDVQEVMPPEYGFDEAGNCELVSNDQCFNIASIQLSVPTQLLRDTDGNCYIDVCPNLENLQRDIPTGYTSEGGTCRPLEQRALLLSELLPNVTGTDTGQEFIEMYNPNDDAISTAGYELRVGKNLETTVTFGLDVQAEVIPAHGYLVYHDDELGLSLLNTDSRVSIRAPAGNIVSETSYSDPREDQSWALIGGTWQYTDQVTPNAMNLPALPDIPQVAGISTTVSSLPSCPAGKYRHPITNRCRNIETDTAMLVACGADEYRNPDTNRCRKIAALTSTLAPCKEGYERNELTNRCRKVTADTSVLAACQEGYERNPSTNRCRKITTVSTALKSPATAIDSPKQSSSKTILILSAGISAVAYGVYEWRSELGRGIRKIIQILSVPGK